VSKREKNQLNAQNPEAKRNTQRKMITGENENEERHLKLSFKRASRNVNDNPHRFPTCVRHTSRCENGRGNEKTTKPDRWIYQSGAVLSRPHQQHAKKQAKRSETLVKEKHFALSQGSCLGGLVDRENPVQGYNACHKGSNQ